MILFLSRTAISQEVLVWVSRETGLELHLTETLEQAMQLLRATPCRVAVVDAGLLETDPKGIDKLLCEIPSAMPIFPNLAVCGPERLVNEIKASLRRGEKDSQRAHDNARRELRSHLRDAVTAFLLNCDLALQIPGLPNEAGKKILLLHDLATRMRDLLEAEVGRAASA